MKLTTSATVPVYTIAGEGTSRPLPEWLAKKRKRSLKKDAEYANRVELLQDFEFEEASQCVRVSEDGDWVVSTGTYKPQMHVHNLAQLSLSYARHTNALNQSFVLLSDDYTKSLHLQTDRSLEFHNPGGLHYTTRIPRYGRDLVYNSRSCEALIPTVGVNSDGLGEVFRLNLEVGRFMKGFEVEVGGDDMTSLGGGALQGGIAAGAVNCASTAEASHGLMAFGTSLGTVEFWDDRSRSRVKVLGSPATSLLDFDDTRPEITAIEFHADGLELATGTSNGLIHTYDLRSPVPLMKKDQGYGFPIQTLTYLTPRTSSSSISQDKLLSSDRKSIKLFDTSTPEGDLWTSIQPHVDLNHVAWVPDTGMLLTANEGRQQHSFFIPQLGPAPKWCSFLDNLVEEMADDQTGDPAAYTAAKANSGVGDVYDNYKFVSTSELQALKIDHLVGDSKTNVLRPYMHGYFVPQRLYEQARLLANPDLALEQRQRSIQEKIEKERESRIRGSKKVNVKVNRKLAEKLAARDEANERRKALRMLKKGGDTGRTFDANAATVEKAEGDEVATKKPRMDLMDDSRFRDLFEDEDFQIDEESREYQLHNPSSATTGRANGDVRERGLTAAEEEALDGDDDMASSDDDDDDESERWYFDHHGTTNSNAVGGKPTTVATPQMTRTGLEARIIRSRAIGVKINDRKLLEPRECRVFLRAGLIRKLSRYDKDDRFGDLASTASGRNAEAGGGFSRSNGRGGIVGEKEVSLCLLSRKVGGGNEGSLGWRR